MVALGGRAAEQIVLGEVSTGAGSDLKTANNVARSMITKYGMSESLENLIYGNENDEVFIGRDFAQARNYSEEVAAKIDREVKKIMDSAYKKVLNVLNENIHKLHKLAGVLLEKEKVEGPEFEEIYTSTNVS
jgi:cell division protease FtsH